MIRVFSGCFRGIRVTVLMPPWYCGVPASRSAQFKLHHHGNDKCTRMRTEKPDRLLYRCASVRIGAHP